MTGMVISVLASERRRRFEPGSDAQPGDNGSPTATGMSITLPRCTPSGGRMGPFGINVALIIAVVARVGIDEATDRAMFGGDLGLGAAPALYRSGR